jgi:hypothetical protein
VKLTQTRAILRYIARKFDLVGKSEEENIRLDLIDAEAEDFKNGFAGLCYNPNFVSFGAVRHKCDFISFRTYRYEPMYVFYTLVQKVQFFQIV